MFRNILEDQPAVVMQVPVKTIDVVEEATQTYFVISDVATPTQGSGVRPHIEVQQVLDNGMDNDDLPRLIILWWPKKVFTSTSMTEDVGGIDSLSWVVDLAQGVDGWLHSRLLEEMP